MTEKTVDYQDLYLATATAKNLITAVNDDISAEIIKRSQINKESASLGAILNTLLKQSSRVHQWAFDLKRLNYSPSISELQDVQNLLVDNAILVKENRENIMHLSKTTDYKVGLKKVIKNWGYFTILQDQIMESIVGLLMQEMKATQN